MMSKQEFYVQCMLQKENVHTTAWIEEKYAVLNKHVAMEKPKDSGKYEEGWIVTGVGSKMDAKLVKDHSHNDGKGIWTATSGSCPRGNK